MTHAETKIREMHYLKIREKFLQIDEKLTVFKENFEPNIIRLELRLDEISNTGEAFAFHFGFAYNISKNYYYIHNLSVEIPEKEFFDIFNIIYSRLQKDIIKFKLSS